MSKIVLNSILHNNGIILFLKLRGEKMKLGAKREKSKYYF